MKRTLELGAGTRYTGVAYVWLKGTITMITIEKNFQNRISFLTAIKGGTEPMHDEITEDNRSSSSIIRDSNGIEKDRDELIKAIQLEVQDIDKVLNIICKYKDEEFKQVGNEISNARNVARAHYKSDSDMGKKLGESMYNYIKNGKR